MPVSYTHLDVYKRQTAINLDGKLAESWANQALIYERRGEMNKASKSYAQALRLDPNYKPAKDGLARTRGGANAAQQPS